MARHRLPKFGSPAKVFAWACTIFLIMSMAFCMFLLLTRVETGIRVDVLIV